MGMDLAITDDITRMVVAKAKCLAYVWQRSESFFTLTKTILLSHYVPGGPQCASVVARNNTLRFECREKSNLASQWRRDAWRTCSKS